MNFTSLLTPERVVCNHEASSKKRAFETLAKLLTFPEEQLNAVDIFDALINREKLGCTALGNSIAIPHACVNIPSPRIALLTLEESIELDAPDKKPVSILIGLLLPKNSTETETEILHKLIISFANKNFVQDICRYNNPQQIIDFFSENFSPILVAA
jgi:PTS system nitrogen regulatory IIA component